MATRQAFLRQVWEAGVVAGRLALVAVLLLAACGSTTPQPTTPEQAAAPTEAPSTPSPTEPPTESIPASTATPEATATAEPEPTATPTPEPSPTPEPTPAPEPTVAGANCRVIDDFTSGPGQWQIVLDGVMGGRSNGQASITDEALALTGTINTNGGGFVQVRRPIEPADLVGATSLRFVAETDGRGYEAFFTDALPSRARSVSHFATIDFATPDSSGLAIGTVALADLEARSFGTPIFTDAFRPDLVFAIGVILSDGIDGDFEITLDRIEACP